jgi:hypothetical protein
MRKNYYLKSDIIDYSVRIRKYFRRQSTIQSYLITLFFSFKLHINALMLALQ